MLTEMLPSAPVVPRRVAPPTPIATILPLSPTPPAYVRRADTAGLSPTIALVGADVIASAVAVGMMLLMPKNAPKLSLRATRPTPFAACAKYLRFAGGLVRRPFH